MLNFPTVKLPNADMTITRSKSRFYCLGTLKVSSNQSTEITAPIRIVRIVHQVSQIETNQKYGYIYTTASEARFPSPISPKEYDIAGSTPESLRQLSHIHGDFITPEVEPVPPLPS